MVTTQVKADAVVHVKVRSADNKPVDGRVELSGDGVRCPAADISSYSSRAAAAPPRPRG